MVQLDPNAAARPYSGSGAEQSLDTSGTPKRQVPFKATPLTKEVGKVNAISLNTEVGKAPAMGDKKISPLARTAWEVAGAAGIVFSVFATAGLAAGIAALSFTVLPLPLIPFSLAGMMFMALILPPVGGIASIAITQHLGGLTKEKEEKLKKQLEALDQLIKEQTSRDAISVDQESESYLKPEDKISMPEGLVFNSREPFNQDEQSKIRGVIGQELNRWREADPIRNTQPLGVVSSLLAVNDNAVGLTSKERYIFRNAEVKKANGTTTIELEILQLQDASESKIFPDRTMIPIRMTLTLTPDGYTVSNIRRPHEPN